MIKKIPYLGKYPSAARLLMQEGMTAAPRQSEKELRWASALDITYTLRGMTPAAFKKYSDTLLLLAYQETSRYKEYRWKFAGFDVKLGRLKKGKDLPEIATFQTAMHDDEEIMVYGEDILGYEVPQKHFLNDQVDKVLDIAKRYAEKVSKQTPFRVLRLVISIREPWPK